MPNFLKARGRKRWVREGGREGLTTASAGVPDAVQAGSTGSYTLHGFPGYFLVVADFINREATVFAWVCRGSGAGLWSRTRVAIDRFRSTTTDFRAILNPPTVSMPDFDVDF